MENRNNRYDILKTELELTQRQVDKYDTLSTTVKAWAVTLWTASTGWALQSDRKDILLVGILILVIFWFFDAMNKTFRRDYKSRRVEVSKVMAVLFETGEIPAGTVAPNLPDHDMFKGALKGFFMIHIALPYLVLILVSVFLFMRAGV